MEIYGKHKEKNAAVQGGIVSFNIKRSDGSYYGYFELQEDAALNHIHIRAGSQCNPGASRYYLHLPMGVYEA